MEIIIMSKNVLWVIVAILVIGLGVVAVQYANQPDDRNAIQRLGDAAEELPNGASAAAEQLEDRTPIERAGDAIEEATDGDGR